jgi:hypothetical protein
MTPKDEKIADLAKRKLDISKEISRLKSYENYIERGEFNNPTLNKKIVSLCFHTIRAQIDRIIYDKENDYKFVDMQINKLLSKDEND